MRITLGVGVTRAGVDELITGLWTFANVLGLLTDDIGERTAAEGVTVDGLLIKDAGIPEAAVTAHEAALAILQSQVANSSTIVRSDDSEVITALWSITAILTMTARLHFSAFPAAGSDVITSTVTGDSVNRHIVNADGTHEWGPGDGAVDTNLYRNAADELKSDDHLTSAVALRTLGNLLLASRVMLIDGTTTDDDVPTGGEVVQLCDPNGSTNISGFAGGSAGRFIILCNTESAGIGILSDNSGSVAANRILCPGNANFTLDSRDSVTLWYDTGASRWRVISLAG